MASWLSSDARSEAESRILSPALQAVLQLIVDRVRELVGAQYAALGIVDDQGLITDFITSGITADERRALD